MKSRKKVEELKNNWMNDPCWDIYETEGFEEYRDELFEFQKRVEKENEEIRLKELNDKADSLGISGNIKLAQYILNLEWKISSLSDKIQSIQGQLYSGR